MVSDADIGRKVVICAKDSGYAFVDGWIGTLAGFESGCGRVHVPSLDVTCGYKVFFVPVDQLDLALRG